MNPSSTLRSHLFLWGGFAAALFFGTRLGLDPANIDLAQLSAKYPQIGAILASLFAAYRGANGLRMAAPPPMVAPVDTVAAQQDVSVKIMSLVYYAKEKKDQAMVDAAIEYLKLSAKVEPVTR